LTTPAVGAGAPRQRGLTARSMILSAFLGSGAPARASDILSLADMMGLGQSAVRVALTRMVAAGDLERAHGVYRLSPRLLARQERQEEALNPRVHAWNGQWTMVVVATPGGTASERSSLRDALRQSRFRELRDGVWTRPNNVETNLPAHLSDRSTRFVATPVDSAVELTERLFQPAEWSDFAESLLMDPALDGPLGVRFELAAAMIRHLLDDPLLPDELSPPEWPGTRLRASYDRFRREFARLAEHHLGHPVTTEEFTPD